jgi:hypothetical protein
MQTSEDLRSAIKNIRYYADKISKLALQQLEQDYQHALHAGINTGPGSVRFESLACIGATATDIIIRCDNIEQNLKSAESQDSKLWTEEDV